MRKRNHQQHSTQSNSSGSRELIISVAILMITTLGTTIPLYIHNSNQTAAQIEAIRGDVKSIQAEMRDFHGRLISIEERNKK